ncbi:uncharacterized protein LOC143215675 isoform X2 [Lasioglossum baleicum]|uniref:uncharacterized protein LOC143215675 isoform X2 n=1 Tax=Lasioglossum baleicum TaxID=434251 RepID=UPI003FCDA879
MLDTSSVVNPSERHRENKMDEYDKKFAEMQKYIPFLEAMIERLQNVKDKSREGQLQKMQSLHGILSNSKRKLKIETLQRCEDILQKLHNKVEKGNTPGLHFPSKKNGGGSTQIPTSSGEVTSAEQTKASDRSQRPKELTDEKNAKTAKQKEKEKRFHETPASPTPPVSPDSGSQVAPIIIPTERNVDFERGTDSKPASPDPIETVPTKTPIIIPTERATNDRLDLSPSSLQRGSTSAKGGDDVCFSEWDMLEENEVQHTRNKTWSSSAPVAVASVDDVSATIKMVGSQLPQKASDGRVSHGSTIPLHTSRHIPTVPVPSLGGSRRLTSMLEKNRIGLDIQVETRPESPVNVPDARLKSPDPDILFPKRKIASPRLKETVPVSKPPAPLLSPPPVSNKPPLTMEDLAELLNEEDDDNKAEKKQNKSKNEVTSRQNSRKEAVDATSDKDPKLSKFSLLTQEELDSESEKRWEEVDKHIVKLTSRKCLPNAAATGCKGAPAGSAHNADKTVDVRGRPPSPGSKAEPRYADNYERHPRQMRDNHGIADKDKGNVHAYCRPDEDVPIPLPVPPPGLTKLDERGPIMYQRRPGNSEMVPPRIDADFRMEGPEYFNRIMPGQGHWQPPPPPPPPLLPPPPPPPPQPVPPPHVPVNANDFCNNQWPQSSNFAVMPTTPVQNYQHPMGMHQEMWNVGSVREPIHVDLHPVNEGPLRPNQFPPNMNIRPMMSPNTNLIPCTEDMPSMDTPNIQPMISPTRFPVGPQYRNFPTDGRPYETSFDRPVEYPHPRQSWDSPSARPPSDTPYRPDNEVPCGVKGPADAPGPYSRPSTPCPWNRADRAAGRGRSAYYNERARPEQRGVFNRDARRPEWSRDTNEWDNCNRFSRDNRNISERDPRVRMEHGAINQTPNQPRDAGVSSVRDPRLAKDKHFPPNKNKDVGLNERDPRKRSTGPPFTSPFRKTKEKNKSPPKPPESKPQEKAAKDKMQSPLESLYGVIDTKAKSAQGSLQNFKIPKIKRTELLESPTSSHIPEETKTVNPPWERREGKAKGKKDKDDTAGEVSSSSDGNLLLDEDWNGDAGGVVVAEEESLRVEPIESVEPVETIDPIEPIETIDLVESVEPVEPVESVEEKAKSSLDEPDPITTSTTFTKAPGTAEPSTNEHAVPEGSKPKEEVTQEWIESLIRKSFQFGEGKKFVEQAKFMQRLGEVFQAKKLKKIKKIIESESESSSSDKEDSPKVKKVLARKKRRVIVSDSSDDDFLAANAGILNTWDAKNASDDSQQKPEQSSSLDAEPCNSERAKEDDKLEDTAAQNTSEDKQAVKEDRNASSKEKSKPKNGTETKEDPKDEDQGEESRMPKAKAKRRNSLEMLQEDIREMFISDDVIAATGYRMCRAQKEAQPGASSVNVTPPAKKDESTKEVVSDSEESSVASLKSRRPGRPRIRDDAAKDNVKDKDGAKIKAKSKKEEGQRVTRQRSKQRVHSSDSEDDQPLALRSERVLGLILSSNQDEESDTLRRSKRINKDIAKEPRVVVEKTDMSKLLFDSSSDESFGIDVSELTAAVDIALRPDADKMPEPDTPEKKPVQNAPRKMPRKKSSATVAEAVSENKDDVLTDEESIISDVSMTSSVASGKKINSSSKPDSSRNKEELLSNILVGLCGSKSDLDKDSSTAEKVNFADVDDDIRDQLCLEQSAKKSSVKKKKKKCNWQLGILSTKKKRKKTPLTCSAKDSEPNVSTELDTSHATDCSFECPVAGTPLEMTEDVVEVAGSNDPPKSIAKANVRSESTGTDRAFAGLDIKKLIDYSWTGQERYKCLLCFFTGKNIVHHYKLSHPGKEILISRLKAADAQLAIQDSKDNDLENFSLQPLTEEIFKFQCRICSFFTEGAAKVALEAFYEHCTTHTGEYRFRCNSCSYQAVAKSSMRTHYYKVCRKFKGTFTEAITEDEVPDENRVYGYLCSICNYIQLKRSNLELHVQLWHKDSAETNIVKVNMSLGTVKTEPPINVLASRTVKAEELRSSSESLEESKVNVAVAIDETKTEIESPQKNKVCDMEAETKTETKTETEMVNDPEIHSVKNLKVVKKNEKKDSREVRPELSERTKGLSGSDSDTSLPTGKLSVFVCPPELEKKEVEIQLERKRKMQEIIQNIGIKLQKDTSKKGVSIIDKLKDKMKTNAAATTNENESDVTPDSSKVLDNPTTLTSSAESLNSVTDLPSGSNASITGELETSYSQDSLDNKQSETSVSKSRSPNTEFDSQSASEADQTDLKIRDPLATLGQKKNDETDAEVSDIDNARESTVIYESDSSSEQSDTELSTDVNMILKETSNINASSKDPMLTTIQRLAAQLQATKPLEPCKEESYFKPIESPEKTFNFGSISKPPGIVPVASKKRSVGKTDNEISHETQNDTNPPKNFIRLRRLSGDMLSAMNQPLDVPEDGHASKPGEVTSPDKVEGLIKSDGEEECSFLKIENVVSLAPSVDKDGTESPIINDIRKAVEISPVKKAGVSILKPKPNTSPLILKKLNTIRTIRTIGSDTLKLIPVTNTQLTRNFVPIAPKKVGQVDNKLQFPFSVKKSTVVTPVTRTVTLPSTSQSTNLNYKIVKMIQTPTILKPIDPALKLKSADAYNAMLHHTKLIHLYKCMARLCHFTTDAVDQFQQHYQQHADKYAEQGQKPPFDYQKCAYCYTTCDGWQQMKTHIQEKHAHCRYQCIFCFYRAVAISYVRIHQAVSHPGQHGVLAGKWATEAPAKETVNRPACIHPYICEHDCGKVFYVPELFVAHLKSKHWSPTAKFKCHLCTVTCSQIDQLITHYKIHWIYKYQCQYCLSGADTLNDMYSHLSSFHCNRLPQVIERTHPTTRTSRNEDQLTLRILDDNTKVDEVIIDVDNDEATTKDPAASDIAGGWSNPDTSFSDSLENINMLGKDENEALNKSLSSLFPSYTTPTAESPLQEKISPERPELATPPKPIENKTDPLDISLLDTPKIFNILPVNCTDEFININLLDNPDFLKNVGNQLNSVSPPKLAVATDSKGEDSDIEIVDIVNSGTSSSKIDKKVLDSNKKENPDTVKRVKTDETETKEELSIDNENSSKSTESTDGPSNAAVKPSDKPLTLEDIKDTGFTGADLYKCGFESCDYGAQNATDLESHSKACPQRRDNKYFNCAHCNKRGMKMAVLLEHLKRHGLKRFGCSLCKMRRAAGSPVMIHMKMKHKYAGKLVPADPKNPSVDGLFVVQAISQSAGRKGKKRKNSKSTEKEGDKATGDLEKSSFGPDEIGSLPRQAIYNRVVQCAVCPFTTKVRTNIIRHLTLHLNDMTVPESGPVNPVPCLDKKERMFDKMVNLASSSHQNGRMGGKPKETSKVDEDEFIPKFVPEHKRYVCGVAECNYLTVDEAMLRCHLKALHSEEQYFRCPHCPQPQPGQEGLNIAIDKMAVHLKMHDTRLYKCSHCNNHHYHRHVVERHLTDKHPEKRPFVKVIRELEYTENNQSAQEENEEEIPDPDGNHWKCNMCDYKCVYKNGMATHCSTVHDEKLQYKCTLCPFKASGKIMFEQHINSKHANDPNVDYELIYQRIKGVNKKSGENVERSGQGEPFDTTPLWRRDMPRIRHIRGILLEDENETSTESPTKQGKRKIDAEPQPTKPAKMKLGKLNFGDDVKAAKEKSRRLPSCDKAAVESENSSETVVATDKMKDTKTKTVDDNDSNESDTGRFGSYGKSDGNMYVCTLCPQFKTKYKHDMRDHLYRELNYLRWHCRECGYLSVNRNALSKHFVKHHNGERPPDEPLSPDKDIEYWVSTLLAKQTVTIKAFIAKQNLSNSDAGNNSKTSTVQSTAKQSASAKTSASAKAVNVTNKSNTRDSKITELDHNVDPLEDGSKDTEGLIMDESPVKSEKSEMSTSEADAGKEPGTAEDDQKKPLVCKHCKMTFTRWRGFKLHMQLTHLKRLGFLCPYCDRSTNSEGLMRQHIRSKHPDCPEKIVQNPDAGGPELTDEFWQKEYGLVFPKRSKKRKRKLIENNAVVNDGQEKPEKREKSEKREKREKLEGREKCAVCNFVAVNLAGLKGHMRMVHLTSKQSLKCTYCSFVAATKAELWNHAETQHPRKSDNAAAFDSSSESGSMHLDKKAHVDDCSDEIEEEQVSDTKDNSNTVRKLIISDKPPDQLIYPYRYEEIELDEDLEEWPAKPECSKTETKSSYGLYLQQSCSDAQVDASGSRQDGWICQWCDEFCDSEIKMKTHHEMFHSHLPLNFEKQQKTKESKGYVCPECSFTTASINVMKNHITKHNLFKCKYCERTFSSPTQVSAHSTEEHPGMEVKAENIQNHELLLEKILDKMKWQKPATEHLNANQQKTLQRPKIHAVAKKSTARSTVRPNLMSYKVKAVARKSTNPHSRYLSSSKIDDKQESPKTKQFSYYGIPRSPVNLAKLNTYMVVGGHRMKVNCTTLSQLINIDPEVILRDLKHKAADTATLKKSK